MKSYKEDINLDKLPQHIAIIMDGNGRWAKSRGEKRTFGHKNAISAVRNAINACQEVGVPFLTLYTFSSENWNRPEEEVSTLMTLLYETLLSESSDMLSKGLRLWVIGNIDELPELVREQLLNVMEITKNNTKANLILAINYGSQKEIIKAVKEISQKIKNGTLSTEDINEETFENHLYTKNFPAVDLMIRTSGEIRISNFLLWQLAYAELQFLDVLWPDFSKEDLFKAIVDYQKTERRYGKTSEQINNAL